MTSTKRSSRSRRRCRIALIELQKDTLQYLTVLKCKGQFAAIKQTKRVANETVQAGSSILIGSSKRLFCESDSREFRNSFLGALTRLWFVLCSFIAASFKLCRKRSAPSSPCSCVRGVSVTSDWDLYRLVRLSKSEFRVSKIPLQIGPRSSRDASSSLDGISGNARRSWWSDIELKTFKSSSSGSFVKRCQHSHLRYEVSRE